MQKNASFSLAPSMDSANKPTKSSLEPPLVVELKPKRTFSYYVLGTHKFDKLLCDPKVENAKKRFIFPRTIHGPSQHTHQVLLRTTTRSGIKAETNIFVLCTRNSQTWEIIVRPKS